jgi:hypothetical protein
LAPARRDGLWRHVHSDVRFGGILWVAQHLRMPQWRAFGTEPMRQGDLPTDYDHARTFILAQREREGITGRIAGSFYPEVMHLPAVERVVALAQAHVGCHPAGQRQTNLFHLCGFYNGREARETTRPKGTTCALFLRAVLVAAGDKRFTKAVLPVRPHMFRSMGVEYDDNKNKPTSAEWLSALPDNKALSATDAPGRGDLYHIVIPSVLTGKKASNGEPIADSGHDGIVVSARRTAQSIVMETIDGGQASDGAHGWWTTMGTRTFAPAADGSGRWEMTSHPAVRGHKLAPAEKRVLVGWARLAMVAAHFRQDYGTMANGTVYRVSLDD